MRLTLILDEPVTYQGHHHALIVGDELRVLVYDGYGIQKIDTYQISEVEKIFTVGYFDPLLATSEFYSHIAL